MSTPPRCTLESARAAIDADYRRLEPLAAGRDTQIWRSLDRRHGRLIALKLSAVNRAARAPIGLDTSGLRHPHLVETFREGPGFVAMELATQGTAVDYLRRTYGEQLTAERVRFVLRAGAQVASALDYLHQRRLLHRDVSPTNILLSDASPHGTSSEVRALLGDFELLASADGGSDVGLLEGTLAYMAPEQQRGEAVDLRADLFALGATLLALINGELPFGGDDPAALLAAKSQTRWRCAEQARRLLGSERLQLFAALLEPSRDNRPATAHEVQLALDPTEANDAEPGIRRLVGREPVMRRIAAALERSLEGQHAVITLTGPARAGRTAVLNASAELARALGLRVFEGKRLGATRQPGLYVVDDLDRQPASGIEATATNARAIALASRRDGEPAPVLLLSWSSDSPVSSHLTAQFADRTETGLEALAIGPISLAETTTLVELSLVTRAKPSEFAATLHEASGGRPGLFEPLLLGRSVATGLAGVLVGLTGDEVGLLRKLAISRVPWPARLWRPHQATAQALIDRRLLRLVQGQSLKIQVGAVVDALLGDLTPAVRRVLATALALEFAPRRGTRLALELALAAENPAAIRESLAIVLNRLSARGSWSPLLELLPRALSLVTLPNDLRAQAELSRARARFALGDLEECAQAAQAALAAAETADSQDIATEAALVHGAAAAARGYPEIARASRENALGRAVAAKRPDLQVSALIELRRAAEALRVARRAGDLTGQARAHTALGELAALTDDSRRARLAFRAAARVAVRGADNATESMAYHWLGNLAVRAGEYDAAGRWWRRAFARLGPAAPAARRLSLLNNLGLLAEERDHWAEARERYETALELSRQSGDRLRTLLAMINAIRIHTLLLQPTDALRIGAEATTLAELQGDPAHIVNLNANLGNLARLLDDDREVERLAQPVTGSGDVHAAANTVQNLAEILTRRGRVYPSCRREAEARLRDGLAAIQDKLPDSEVAMGMEIDLLVIQLRHDPRERRACLEEVRARATRLGVRSAARTASIEIVNALGESDPDAQLTREVQSLVAELDAAPLGEFTLFALAAAARATGELPLHARVIATIDQIAHRLGPQFAPGFLGRFDVAAAVLSATQAAIAGDLSLALRYAALLTDCPTYGWRADVALAVAGDANDHPGVASFRAARARGILHHNPQLRLEASLTPELAAELALLAGLP